MKQEISYCDRCMKNLEIYGEMAAEVYKEICMHYSIGNAIHCDGKTHGKGETIIRFLEVKGYLVTTEIGKKDLYAKPNGYKKTFMGYKYDHQFCIGHENEIEFKDERE